jgi:hypothetical protein
MNLYIITGLAATDTFYIQYLSERIVQGATCWTMGAFGGAYLRAAAQRLRDR